MISFCGNGHELRKPHEGNCPYCYCEKLETRIQELEEALERIAEGVLPEKETTLFYRHLCNGMMLTAKEALNKAGGGE